MSTTHSPSASLRASSRNCRCSLPQKILQALACELPPQAHAQALLAREDPSLLVRAAQALLALVRAAPALLAREDQSLRADQALLAREDMAQPAAALRGKGEGAKAKSLNGYGEKRYMYIYMLHYRLFN